MQFFRFYVIFIILFAYFEEISYLCTLFATLLGMRKQSNNFIGNMKHFSHKLTALLLAMTFAAGLYAGELTVAEGTFKNEYSPFYGWNADVVNTQCQTLFLKEELTDLAGGAINALKFYSSTESVSWAAEGAEFEVSLAEVDEADFSKGVLTPEFISVYKGLLAIENYELNIAFAENFPYSGEKNLLLEIKVNAKGKYAKAEFYGVSPDEQLSIMAYPGWTGTQTQKSYFTPKTTFVFETQVVTCPRPTKLTSEVTADGAVFAWQAEEGAKHQVCVVEKDASAAGWQLLDADVLTFTATGLTAGTAYDFYVRTYCSETEQSKETKVSFKPECKAPANVEISDMTHAAATLSWEAVAGIDKYQFVCVRKDSTPEWDGVEAKAVLSVTVDTLKASTTYDFYVRSYFSAETQSVATKLTFTTNCVALEMPYEETFASSNLPACWTAGSKWTMDTSNDDHTTGGATGFLRYNAGSVSDAVSASIELTEDALLDFFYQNRYNSAAIPFDVVILDASKDSELLSESITTASPSDKWAQKTIDLSEFTGKTIKIKFRGNSTSKGYIRIDDLSITAKPCTTPTNPKAAASTVGAVVTWTAGGSEVAWNLRYKAVGAEEWTEIKNIDEPTYTIGECSPEAEYEVQVQAACNGDKLSEWTASATFTPVCPVPTKLAVKEVEDNRALVVWECTESVFHLQFKQADAEDWAIVDSVIEKSYELTDLTASTAYQVKVQTACGSAYTDAISFATRCAPLEDTIPYVLHMDSVAVGSMPECWFVLPRTAEVEVALMNDSTHRLLIAGEQECWIVLPALDAELQGLTVSVTWSGSALQEIGYLTTADPETFVPLAAFSGLPAECNLRNASADAKYVAFHYAGTSEFSIGYIAQVQIAETTDETAIYTPTTNNQTSHKMLRDGQLLIEHNGTLYNAQGQKL